MGNHKISVRLNGEKTKLINDEKESSKVVEDSYKEQAATVEHNFHPDDLIEFEKQHTDFEDSDENWYQVKRGKNRKLPRAFKLFIFAALAASIIGVSLGFIMLRMFAGIDENGGNPITQPATSITDETEDSNSNTGSNTSGNTSTFAIESLEAIVIQAGVYSTVENADAVQQQFSNAGYPAMVWNNGEDYRVFAGISNTEAQADTLAASMDADGLETHVRGWQTEAVEIEIEESVINWLADFPAMWKDSLSVLVSDNSLTSEVDKWKSWIEAYPEQNQESASPMFQAGQQFIQAIEDGQEAGQLQISLLELWERYIALGQ